MSHPSRGFGLGSAALGGVKGWKVKYEGEPEKFHPALTENPIWTFKTAEFRLMCIIYIFLFYFPRLWFAVKRLKTSNKNMHMLCRKSVLYLRWFGNVQVKKEINTIPRYGKTLYEPLKIFEFRLMCIADFLRYSLFPPYYVIHCKVSENDKEKYS